MIVNERDEAVNSGRNGSDRRHIPSDSFRYWYTGYRTPLHVTQAPKCPVVVSKDDRWPVRWDHLTGDSTAMQESSASRYDQSWAA